MQKSIGLGVDLPGLILLHGLDSFSGSLSMGHNNVVQIEAVKPSAKNIDWNRVNITELSRIMPNNRLDEDMDLRISPLFYEFCSGYPEEGMTLCDFLSFARLSGLLNNSIWHLDLIILFFQYAHTETEKLFEKQFLTILLLLSGKLYGTSDVDLLLADINAYRQESSSDIKELPREVQALYENPKLFLILQDKVSALRCLFLRYSNQWDELEESTKEDGGLLLREYENCPASPTLQEVHSLFSMNCRSFIRMAVALKAIPHVILEDHLGDFLCHYFAHTKNELSLSYITERKFTQQISLSLKKKKEEEKNVALHGKLKKPENVFDENILYQVPRNVIEGEVYFNFSTFLELFLSTILFAPPRENHQSLGEEALQRLIIALRDIMSIPSNESLDSNGIIEWMKQKLNAPIPSNQFTPIVGEFKKSPLFSSNAAFNPLSVSSPDPAHLMRVDRSVLLQNLVTFLPALPVRAEVNGRENLTEPPEKFLNNLPVVEKNIGEKKKKKKVEAKGTTPAKKSAGANKTILKEKEVGIPFWYRRRGEEKYEEGEEGFKQVNKGVIGDNKGEKTLVIPSSIHFEELKPFGKKADPNLGNWISNYEHQFLKTHGEGKGGEADGDRVDKRGEERKEKNLLQFIFDVLVPPKCEDNEIAGLLHDACHLHWEGKDPGVVRELLYKAKKRWILLCRKKKLTSTGKAIKENNEEMLREDIAQEIWKRDLQWRKATAKEQRKRVGDRSESGYFSESRKLDSSQEGDDTPVDDSSFAQSPEAKMYLSQLNFNIHALVPDFHFDGESSFSEGSDSDAESAREDNRVGRNKARFGNDELKVSAGEDGKGVSLSAIFSLDKRELDLGSSVKKKSELLNSSRMNSQNSKSNGICHTINLFFDLMFCSTYFDEEDLESCLLFLLSGIIWTEKFLNSLRHVDCHLVYSFLSRVLFYMKEFELGKRAAYKAKVYAETLLGHNSIKTAIQYNNFSVLLCSSGDYQSAYAHLALSQEILNIYLGVGHPWTTVVVRNLNRLSETVKMYPSRFNTPHSFSLLVPDYSLSVPIPTNAKAKAKK